MRVAEIVRCEALACSDVVKDRYTVPAGPPDPDTVTVLMVAEAPPPDPAD
ncbi:MAG: hypothetical protein ACXVQZ_07360 [Gaiellaceae bacterium]